LNSVTNNTDISWIASEICYYLGLVLAALILPATTIILCIMSLVGKTDPDYRYILIAWILSVAMFLAGIWLKNRIVTANRQTETRPGDRSL
jgi:phosphoglycerol transferase MdoB-like AlkP superfamily enzyme